MRPAFLPSFPAALWLIGLPAALLLFVFKKGNPTRVRTGCSGRDATTLADRGPGSPHHLQPVHENAEGRGSCGEAETSLSLAVHFVFPPLAAAWGGVGERAWRLSAAGMAAGSCGKRESAPADGKEFLAQKGIADGEVRKRRSKSPIRSSGRPVVFPASFSFLAFAFSSHRNTPRPRPPGKEWAPSAGYELG